MRLPYYNQSRYYYRLSQNTAVVFESIFKENSLVAEWIINNQVINQVNLTKGGTEYKFRSAQSLLPLQNCLDGRLPYLKPQNMYEELKAIDDTLKIVKNKATNQAQLARLYNITQNQGTARLVSEIEIFLALKQMRPKNILPMRAYYQQGLRFTLIYDAQEDCIPLLQFLQQNQQGSPIPVVAKMMKQILKGISCLHRRHMIIRSIDPKCFILDGTPKKVKLFKLEDAIEENQAQEKHLVGTPGYFPPEFFKGHNHSQLGDIFSAGIIFHRLLTGKQVFVFNSQQELFKMNQDNKQNILRNKIQDPNALDLLEKMLADIQQRPNAEDCLNHVFFRTLKQEHQQDKIQQVPHLKIKSQHKN